MASINQGVDGSGNPIWVAAAKIASRDSEGNVISTTYLKAHPTISLSTDTTSTSAPGYSGTFTVVDGVTRDSNGHVLTINTKTVTMPTAQDLSGYVTKSTLTTKGDIFYASGANTPTRLGIGTLGQVLTVSSGLPAWTSLGTVLKYQGTVANYSDLPTTATAGDVYNVTNANGTTPAGTDYVYSTDSTWDALGGTVDLSGYETTSALTATLEDYVTLDGVNFRKCGYGHDS
jgi:hypothetical protein